MICVFFIPEINKVEFGRFLKELRNGYGLSQSGLSGINRGTVSCQMVSQWESGKKLPDRDTFLNLCHFLVTSPDKMLSGVIKKIVIDLPEPLEHRYARIIQTTDVYDDNTVESEKVYFYYPQKYGRSHHLYDASMGMNAIPYQEAAQGYINDLLTTHLDANQPYEGKIAYPMHGIQQFFTSIDDEKTRENINSLLIKHNIKDETLQALLGYKSVESIRRLKRGDQKWGVDTLFKLTWILDTSFEDLLVYESVEYTQEYDDFFKNQSGFPTEKKVNQKVKSIKKSTRQLSIPSVDRWQNML